ncbi:MAG TPA: DUF2461 domain-containing protein, partial [Magnetospirillaceae bacterium]|nr:DUF2461 domain-containing protein [Magnetospirillaceae bacterium]
LQPMNDPNRMEKALEYLRDLRGHNDRAWFEAKRPRYEAARAAFESLVAELLSGFGPVDDLGGVSPRDCVFRINRDVRFSADKSPYKTAFGALLGPAGRKSGVRSYYLHVEPDGNSMLAGGLHSPSQAELGKVRDAIVRNSAPLRAILASTDFVRRFGGLSGDSLKTAPRGYPKDHPDIGLLRRTQFLAVFSLADADLGARNFVPLALETFSAMKPFLIWLEAACLAKAE